MTTIARCPFCILPIARVERENDLCVAFRDAFPVAEAHTLLVPRRHVASLFELTAEEWAMLRALLWQVRGDLESRYHPIGYNVGVNDGAQAGQTIMHLHVHLIPRYPGDQPDPRGGIRWIFPDKAAYWDKP